MALLTTIALTIGGALVKHVAAGYIGDGAKSQVTQDLLDLVRDQLGDRLTTRPDQPQIDQIAALAGNPDCTTYVKPEPSGTW